VNANAAANYERAFALKPEYADSLIGLGASQFAASLFEEAVGT
jgi:hypothetical protein